MVVMLGRELGQSKQPKIQYCDWEDKRTIPRDVLANKDVQK